MNDTPLTTIDALPAREFTSNPMVVPMGVCQSIKRQLIACQSTLEKKRQEYAKLQLRLIDMEKQLAKVDELHSKLAIAESKADKMVYLEDDLEERNITIERLKMTISSLTETIDTLAIRIARLIEVGR
jgi:predicted RNase H-like nuclease (RuvC/YqgF family)